MGTLSPPSASLGGHQAQAHWHPSGWIKILHLQDIATAITQQGRHFSVIGHQPQPCPGLINTLYLQGTSSTAPATACPKPIPRMSGERTTAFPEVVGKPEAEAVAAIRAKEPGYQVIPLAFNAPTTRDYRAERVRVFIKDGVVDRTPTIG